MEFHFIFLLLIDGSSFFLLVFFQFSILSTIDNHRESMWLNNKARFWLFFVFISANSEKAGIISENIHWEISKNLFFPDSVIWIYFAILFGSGKVIMIYQWQWFISA